MSFDRDRKGYYGMQVWPLAAGDKGVGIDTQYK